MNVIDFLKIAQCNTEDFHNYYFSGKIGHTKVVNFETYGPSALKNENIIEKTPAMVFGSLVDTLLTNPSVFNDLYYVPKNDLKLTNSEKAVYEILSKYDISSIFLLSENDLLDILNRASFYTSLLNNTRVKKILDRSEVFNELLQNRGKTIISNEDLEKAKMCINSLRTSDVTKRIFNYKLLFQVKVEKTITENEIKYLECHGLFDIIALDTKNKIIYPFDLKTTVAPESEFLRSFYKFKYYRQAEMYIDMLSWNLCTCDDFEEWIIEPFKFVVVSPNSCAPLIYEFPIIYENDKLKISENAFVKPYLSIIKEMSWHFSTGQYDYTRDIYMQIYNYANQKSEQFITVPILTNTKTQTQEIEDVPFDDLPYLGY